MPYTAEQQNTHYNSQPKKRVGALAVLFTPDGRLLIVKPSYKDGWSLPGGLVDKDESPLDAVCREIKEELNLALPPERYVLFGVRYVDTRDGRDEDVQIIFMTTLTDEEITTIRLEEDELKEMKFVSAEELANYTDHPRMQAVAAALNAAHVPVFVHNETVITKAGMQ